ncbi:GNAT family N-acetyltransferase [Actinomadura sp. 9N407]|uniref:GNAT family N-acetyltransferase n=1 Tax=Actinomadura sp. 9N407 TaxID=3375154 RepID=UPI0037A14BB1
MDDAVHDLEMAAALGWRAPDEARLGEWLLRAAEGFTGRANSALAVGDAGSPLDETVGAVRDWYAARGLPAMIAVPYATGRPDSSDVDRFLGARGWTIRSGAATVMTASPERIAGSAALEGAASVRLGAEPDVEWLSLYGRDLPAIARRLLVSAPWQAFVRIEVEGGTAAIGRLAGSGQWAGITAVEVDPRFRRRGLGTAITAVLAAQAVERGVRALYLQVEDDNDAARALYRRAGFSEHHGYHYRVAPAAH